MRGPAAKDQDIGSAFDNFLKEECIYAEATGHAIKRVIAWQLAEVSLSIVTSECNYRHCLLLIVKPVPHLSENFTRIEEVRSSKSQAVVEQEYVVCRIEGSNR